MDWNSYQEDRDGHMSTLNSAVFGNSSLSLSTPPSFSFSLGLESPPAHDIDRIHDTVSVEDEPASRFIAQPTTADTDTDIGTPLCD